MIGVLHDRTPWSLHNGAFAFVRQALFEPLPINQSAKQTIENTIHISMYIYTHIFLELKS